MNVGESFSPDVISNCWIPSFRRFLARLVVDFAQRLHVIGNKRDGHNTNFTDPLRPRSRMVRCNDGCSHLLAPTLL